MTFMCSLKEHRGFPQLLCSSLVSFDYVLYALRMIVGYNSLIALVWP